MVSSFSQRTAWRAEPNALSSAIAARRGARLVDLTASNPTVLGFPYDARLLAPLADPRALVYAPDPLGHPEARDAIAGYASSRGTAVDPSRVVVTASTSEAYSYLFHLLADPGDRVLVPAPSYPLFGYLADLAGVTLVPYPLRYDGKWHVDVAALEGAVDERTRAILVVSPNNPTGSYLKRDELAAMRRIALAHGLAIVSDEVFAEYPLADDPTRVETIAGETTGLAFALSGLSKVAALPQAKLGWMIVAGDDALVRGAIERLAIVADTFLSVATPVQLAARDLLASTGAIRDAVRARTRRNLAAIRRVLAPPSPATVLDVEGGWYATVRVPTTRSELDWALALLAEDVLVHPGHFFDFEREAYLVVSLLAPEGDFDRGVEALRRVVERALPGWGIHKARRREGRRDWARPANPPNPPQLRLRGFAPSCVIF